MDNHPPIIQLEGIRFAYTPGLPVLDNLDFTFHRGDKIGLLAPNGSGKTTLFHVIMGLLSPGAGSISLFGKRMERERDFAEMRLKIGLLFQDADDQLFCPTVIEDVAFGPLNMGKSRDEAVRISKETLEFLGLSDFENRITFKLSGGEKKLVSLATILSMSPEVLLLDEPLTGLDARTRSVITKILSRIGLSYIIISHDIEFLQETTSTIYSLQNGRLYVDDQVYVHRHDHAHVLGNVPHKH
jgi:cobalt/nickel transport system ATP-binding protein